MTADRSWSTWLREKRHEIPHLRLRDSLLAKAVADIHRHTLDVRTQLVEIRQCTPIHTIDRPGAEATVRQRAQAVAAEATAITAAGTLDRTTLQRLIPSVSGFHGVRWGHRVVTFEGNGRLAALKMALGDDSAVRIAIAIHVVDEPAKVHRRIGRVRRLNHLR